MAKIKKAPKPFDPTSGPMLSGRPGLGIKPTPVKPGPLKPGPTPRKVSGMVNPVKDLFPGKPGDLKQAAPSFLRRTKPTGRGR